MKNNNKIKNLGEWILIAGEVVVTITLLKLMNPVYAIMLGVSITLISSSFFRKMNDIYTKLEELDKRG